MEIAALIACVPNFSEGRRAEVIAEILSALRVPDVVVVGEQADPEHNRLDATVIGSPDAVRRSALAGATKAVESIDMERHRGGHPRMGAVDVIPFVPLRGITMDECVDLARGFAKELAETLDLPVYLYDRAALSEDRRSLADVRRGEYEGLREAVARGERLPDLGPHRLGRAGATAVGARKPLIAFNVYLDGEDEAAAKAIARAVRESSGGLPAVRAIGFSVPERHAVTVSMNLVDHEVTGLRTAFTEVERLAREHGLAVTSSEIVGLVPEGAISEEDVEELRLEGFDADEQILERLVSRADEAAPIASQTVGGFLAALASDAPTPGGGAVGAVAGAAGAGLISMVCRLTVDNPKFEDSWEALRPVLREADEARATFLELADRDASAFDGVMEAFRMPKDTDEEKAERSAAIQRGYRRAATVPMEIAERAVSLMPHATTAVEIGNPNAASDGLSASHMLFAAARCAIANVDINVAALKDPSVAAPMREQVRTLRETAERHVAAAVAAFDARI
jgi:glutamate formiminotransferase / formiminotetrahydrofolate cyclodeaminase